MNTTAPNRAWEPLLTVAGVCELLQVSRGLVYGLIRAGDLAPVRVGHRIRFVPDDIRTYLNRGGRGIARGTRLGNPEQIGQRKAPRW